jgi:hypothetical protein
MSVIRPRQWRPWRGQHWFAYAAVLLVATSALVVTSGGSHANAELQRYSAVATAEGMSDLVYSPDAPLADTPVDMRVPSAQATVDGLGNAVGFAGAPYPGDTVIAAPGLAASVACSSADYCDGLPSYPLTATSSYPSTPNDLVDAGAFRLVAHSTQYSSAGEASAGGKVQTNSVGRVLADASAAADEATEAVSADSKSSAEVITLGGVLRIGSVTSAAHVELSPEGKVKKTSDVAVNGVTVAGVAVQITPKGIEAGGGTVPIDISSLTGALKAAGITVRTVNGTEDATSISAGTVVITQQQNVQGQAVTHTYTFGGARAAVVAIKVPSVTPPTVNPPTNTGTNTGGATVTPGSPAVPGTTTPGTPSSTIPAPTTAAPNALPIRGVAAFARMWTAQFYLILVVTGLVIVGGARLTTTLAVRRTWTS